ncbi:hypothetical protein BbiDN127_0425 [Borreliella bissettiae DN127]|uniref:Uncharacterized protein n=1 Tax=Borrelia bissettiae (strain DSM 17990 / CIP 109136 / DN127) TaxID=521010 RepID=G0ALM4_BORBD|nr:hypothetical protein BbiDN127_0425 [Borreliella bissettiae DN127]
MWGVYKINCLKMQSYLILMIERHNASFYKGFAFAPRHSP